MKDYKHLKLQEPVRDYKLLKLRGFLLTVVVICIMCIDSINF
jgi:hypothetical protein